MVKDFNLGTDPSISYLTVFDNELFFALIDRDLGENETVWRSDGTNLGTVLFDDFDAYGGAEINKIYALNGYLLIVVDSSAAGTELWIY